MVFKVGDPRPAGAGRRPGQQNQTTVLFKHAVINVFEKGGGEKWLLKWAKRNPTDFFRIAARLIPQEVTGLNGGPLGMHLTGILSNVTPDTLAAMKTEDLQALHDALQKLAHAPLEGEVSEVKGDEEQAA